MKRRISLVLLVIVMMATFAGTAFADPTTHDSWDDHFYEEVDCGDFDVILDSAMRITAHYFAEDSNNPAVVRWQIKYTGITTNTASGNSYPDHTVYNGQRFVSGGSGLHGVVYHVNVPGEGVVMLVAGNIVWDENGDISFVAGPGMYEAWEDPGQEAMLCETMEGL